jgi:hypothetical protein
MHGVVARGGFGVILALGENGVFDLGFHGVIRARLQSWILRRKGKTKTRDTASNKAGGGGPAHKWKSGLKSFLLLKFEIQWVREGLWLDGVEASSKVLSYPA